MNGRNDGELLRGWSRDRCEESFCVLVDRYADLVYGTALRRTGDRQAAEEVAQNVFTALARKAGRIAGADGLGGWLFKTTVLEAAARRRAEARRAKRMREFSDLEEVRREEGGDASSGELLRSLDEVLAELACSDRSLLIARFFNGSSFAELARASGRSEAACRKQASRAMRKLAERLRRRGVRVSTTVLVASLGALTATRAPAGLAGKWAAGAVATKTAAGSAILTAVLTTMSTVKTTSVVAIGIALILVSGGAGFMAGKHSQGTSGAASAGDRAGGFAADGEQKRSARDLALDRGADGSDAAELSRVEAIVASLKRELRGKEIVLALELGKPIAEELRAAEMEEALTLIGGENGNLRRTLALVLYARWGEVDGRAAVDRALAVEDGELRPRVLNAAAGSWGRTDPERAWAWQRELRQSGDLPVSEADANSLAGIVLQQWATRDMDAAWDAFEALEPDLQRIALSRLEDLVAQPEHAEAMAARMAAIEDEALRSRVVEEVGEQWARLDPERATAWFETVEFEDPMLRLRAAMEIGEGWFETEPVGAVDWLWPMVPEQMRDHFARELAGSPGGRESAELQAWLEAQGYDVEELRTRPKR